VIDKVIYKKVEMNRMNGDKEKESYVLIYKEKVYIMDKGLSVDLMEIEDEDYGRESVALQVVLNKAHIKEVI
jgi:hypothetical protein